MSLSIGDRVRLVCSACKGTVKDVDVDKDVQLDADRAVRLPNADTVVLADWKPEGGSFYTSNPRTYYVIPENLVIPL